MAERDRERWNTRYTQGSYRSRPWPSPFLETWVERLDLAGEPLAIDIACGLGRNARYLARQGMRVVGQDISRVALAQARQIDTAENLDVEYVEADFDTDFPQPRSADLISCIRFMNRTLHPHLVQALRPGGWLLFEHHYITDIDVEGPPDSFRLEANELLGICSDLAIMHFEERVKTDRDGRAMALSAIVAQRR